MLSLATIEIQCIMQLLDIRSLLRLAQCHRHLQVASRGEFAWKYQTKGCCLTVNKRFSESILAFLAHPSTVWLDVEIHIHQKQRSAKDTIDLSELQRIPRLTSLHCSAECPELDRVFLHPEHFPLLHTLHLGQTWWQTMAITSGLCQLPCLTRLTVYEGYDRWDISCLKNGVIKCERLKELTIEGIHNQTSVALLRHRFATRVDTDDELGFF